MRDWPAASAGFNRALEIKPDAVYPKIGLAYLEVFRNNNPAAGRKILRAFHRMIPENRGFGTVGPRHAGARLCRRGKDFGRFPLKDFLDGGPKTFFQGRTALARGDFESAQRYFAAAAPDIEGWVRDNPDDAERHALLGLLYAYMQKKEDAVREGRRAVEIEPESQNAFHGALWRPIWRWSMHSLANRTRRSR